MQLCMNQIMRRIPFPSNSVFSYLPQTHLPSSPESVWKQAVHRRDGGFLLPLHTSRTACARIWSQFVKPAFCVYPSVPIKNKSTRKFSTHWRIIGNLSQSIKQHLNINRLCQMTIHSTHQSFPLIFLKPRSFAQGVFFWQKIMS